MGAYLDALGNDIDFKYVDEQSCGTACLEVIACVGITYVYDPTWTNNRCFLKGSRGTLTISNLKLVTYYRGM